MQIGNSKESTISSPRAEKMFAIERESVEAGPGRWIHVASQHSNAPSGYVPRLVTFVP